MQTLDEHLHPTQGLKQLGALLSVVAAWVALVFCFRHLVIQHDSWIHNFPAIYAMGMAGSCSQFADWVMSPDTGAPTLIYAISTSLTQPIRIALLKLLACTTPAPLTAMTLYQLQIVLIYLNFAGGMFILGRTLFDHWLSAVYLTAATLFAGLFYDSYHSDQVAVIAFWVPWIVLAFVLADRHAATIKGTLYLYVATVFLSAALLDQYPHFATLAGGCGLLLYAALRPEQTRLLLSRWRSFWPILILLAIVAAQLLVVKLKIADYVPSLRAAIAVDPSQFGETGFVQPSALFGIFFPLTFTAAYEDIAASFGPMGARGFVYHLDILIFYLGTIPFLLILSWFGGGGQRRLKIGWLAFTLLMLAVSLQQTRIYLVLFQLPFFDVFRSYFLVVIFSVFGALVMSAYGFDRLMTSSESDRARMSRSTCVVGGSTYAAAGLLLASLLIIKRGAGLKVLAYQQAILADAFIIGSALLLFWWLARRPHFKNIHRFSVIAVLVVTQSIYAAGVFRVLGTSRSDSYKSYQLNTELTQPFTAEQLNNPSQLRRAECPTFGSCYLAARDAVSMRRDQEGSFLRQRLNPLYRDRLPAAVSAALLGVTAPFVWASGSVQSIRSMSDLDAIFDGHPPFPQLNETTYLLGYQSSARGDPTAGPHVAFSDLRRLVDVVSVRYQSEAPAVINFGITYDRNWTARINGKRVPTMQGNYGILSLWADAQAGVIELRYDDWQSNFFFWSRYGLVALAVALALLLGLTSVPPRKRLA